MINNKQSILLRIAEHKKAEVTKAKVQVPLQELIKQQIEDSRDFTAALKDTSTPAIIAEIKKASPSKGIIRQDFDLINIAKTYEDHGARCLSVLTDINYFHGHPDYLKIAKNHCSLPVLRKDFIIDSYQIYESRALQADCILLIVALLDDYQLADYCQLAQELGMDVLVESHTKEELERALKCPTPLMGINNRSLHQFTTDLNISIELNQIVPKDRLVITESGINTHDDVTGMQKHGINTFLIGESLMREPDIGKKLDQLING